ncbi:MAG: MmgE/PrpD family protein [Pseudomonadota bacterium]
MTTDPIAFIHDFGPGDLTPALRRAGWQALIDTLGVAASGIATPLSRAIRETAVAEFSAGPGARAARMLFDGRAVSPAGAALAGGMTTDAIDAHDSFLPAKGHVGAALVPALMAISDGGCPGDEVMARLVVGYEIGCRAGIALHATAPDYHTSGAWMAVGCAAAAARARGLDRAATREALGIAEYHGPRSQMMRVIDHPTMLKDGAGWGAMAGVAAAGMAARGFTGAPAITVEGADVAGIWADLGTRWMIAEQSIKPEPVCRWAQPAMHGAVALAKAHGVTADAIARVEVATFYNATRLDHRAPRDTEQAQYALPFPLAAALVRGEVGPDEVRGATLEDPAILDLAARVEMRVEPAFEARYPAARVAAVTIVTRDGRRLESGPVEAAGDPARPFTEAALREKFHAYAVPVIGHAHAAAVEAAIDALPVGTLGALKAAAEAAPGSVEAAGALETV